MQHYNTNLVNSPRIACSSNKIIVICLEYENNSSSNNVIFFKTNVGTSTQIHNRYQNGAL